MVPSTHDNRQGVLLFGTSADPLETQQQGVSKDSCMTTVFTAKNTSRIQFVTLFEGLGMCASKKGGGI